MRHILPRDKFAQGVAVSLAAALSAVVAEHGRVTVALAGGSTPRAVYKALASCGASEIEEVGQIPWDKVVFILGDERWVPTDHPQSNYQMVRESLIEPLAVEGIAVRVLPVDTSLVSPSDGARQYTETVASELRDGVIDIVLLGMGEDGHTASLFPGSDLLGVADEKMLFGACIHPTDGTQRVSLLPRPLKMARAVYFLVTGERKAFMLRRVLNGEDDVAILPSRLWAEMDGEVSWFLDNEAA